MNGQIWSTNGQIIIRSMWYKMAAEGDVSKQLLIETVEMHTGGEPLRIIVKGYPKPEGSTILDKRRYLRKNADHYRKMLMHEPRGHKEMYGALLVPPDHPKAHIGVIFMHNEGNHCRVYLVLTIGPIVTKC